ncbi:hypothetical protein Tdes44962_MAKER01092 [Teratosphaeria destructans]|uniref:Uncharacterized protein n=1 Tax=Teratosphaeria destructans TaxID=418781 RepID=A0A9W7SIE2_9PEZI|nr:hypothetical protein Tdes44962_MAKER01092 [Teratosphaeria destructans]
MPKDEGMGLTVCDTVTDVWTCGINVSACVDNDEVDMFTMQGGNNIILRDYHAAGLEGGSEIAMRVPPLTNFTASAANVSGNPSSTALAAATTTVHSRGGQFTAGDVAGAAVGDGVPLLVALSVSFFVLWSMRRKIRRLEASQKAPQQRPQYATGQLYDQPQHDPMAQYTSASQQTPYADHPVSEIDTEHRTLELESKPVSERT